VDAVTQAFVDRLFELSHRKPELYDFQFSCLPSAYKPLLHALRASDHGVLFCPGESTSMVTEALGYLPREKVMIMDVPEVMSEAHYGHLSEVIKMGGVRILRPDGGMGIASDELSKPAEMTAALHIAKEFLKTESASYAFVLRTSGGAATEADDVAEMKR
jgi:hypothetical protein